MSTALGIVSGDLHTVYSFIYVKLVFAVLFSSVSGAADGIGIFLACRIFVAVGRCSVLFRLPVLALFPVFSLGSVPVLGVFMAAC